MTIRTTQKVRRKPQGLFQGMAALALIGLLGGITPEIACGAEAAEAAPPVMVSFSADVTRTRLDKKMQTRGRMYVSPEGIRGESQRNGVAVVMIHHTARKTVWTLIPSQKSYTERTGVEPARPPLPDEANSPCRHDKSLICRQVGMENLEGRRTLHWEIRMRGPDNRESLQAHLWIDPRLGMAIREQYADGLSVELSHIQEGPQPSELFVIPENFQKTALDSTPQTPPSAGGNSPPTGPSTP
ncbi:MAG: hypothetical protein HQL98_06290 [Magnetococcales bacterium]|nr:hypothetical protein [Magnetococcales bacterium]